MKMSNLKDLNIIIEMHKNFNYSIRIYYLFFIITIFIIEISFIFIQRMYIYNSFWSGDFLFKSK